VPLVALRDDDDHRSSTVQIIELDARKFGATKSRVYADRDDRTVTKVVRAIGSRAGRKEVADLVLAETVSEIAESLLCGHEDGLCAAAKSRPS